MPSEWAGKRAEQLCHACRATNRYAASQFHACDEIAAALDEARAEGERIGAERERWECHRIVDQATRGAWDDAHRSRNLIREAIAARGPMRGPEE